MESVDIKPFATALARVQAKIGMATKDKKNSHFGSKYADLASVWETWQEVGPLEGFSVLQLVQDSGERQGITLETILMHSSGHSISTRCYFPAVKNDAQAYGSALTYARRYALSALVGICPDDDDGNAATGKVQPAVTSDFKKKLSDAAQKYWGEPDKLKLLLNESLKVGAIDTHAWIQGRLLELNNKKEVSQ